MKYKYTGDSLATATVNDGGETLLFFPSELVELESWHTSLPQIARMIALGLLEEVKEETPTEPPIPIVAPEITPDDEIPEIDGDTK